MLRTSTSVQVMEIGIELPLKDCNLFLEDLEIGLVVVAADLSI